MKKTIFEGKRKRTAILVFALVFVVAASCLVISAVRTTQYNRTRHQETFSGSGLFSPDSQKKDSVTVTAVPRSSTWGKIYDPDNLGLTENNIQAYTYDITVANNTPDEVSDFSFRLSFPEEIFLSSAELGHSTIMRGMTGRAIRKAVPGRIFLLLQG